jgi:GT2 family glycosyltransferase
VVVVNWNRRELTLECLASLAALRTESPVQLVVVDNGSVDGSVAAVKAAYPRALVIEMGTNTGFAAGANAGIASALRSGADWVLLLNNDAAVDPDLLTNLLAADATDVGMLVPTITLHDRPGEVWPAAGRRRRLTLAAIDTTAGATGAGPYDVDWAVGCCLLVKRAVWEGVGLFDERYGVYYEDHDLCMRAKAAGWRIVHVPGARATHRVAASAGSGSPSQLYLLARSSVPFFWRHTSGVHRMLIVPYRLGSLAATMLRTLGRGDGAAAGAYVRGLLRGVRDLSAGA